ncbi:MAG: hypothetical protein ACI9AD_000811 [Nitriliruptoraceae bacterium]|jgi:hypothetical protein
MNDDTTSDAPFHEPFDEPFAEPDGAAGAPDRTNRPWAAVVAVAAMASWPFLSLVAVNSDQPLELATITGWWLATLIPTLLVTLLAGRRSVWLGRTVATWLTVMIWTVFSFPVIESLHLRFGPFEQSMTTARMWVIVATGVALVTALVAGVRPVQQFVLVVSVAFAASAGGQLVIGLATPRAPVVATAIEPSASFQTRPNVWFIVLDGLASDAWIERRTGYDARPFEDALEAHGVQVQRAARSNYPLTHISISSTMMMEYGFEGLEEPRAQSFFDQLQGKNAVVELMRANGYGYAHAYPGFWSGSRCSGVEDLCLGSNSSISDTDAALRDMVAFGDRLHRSGQHTDIADANDPGQVVGRIIAADMPTPTFSVVHMLNPHAPLLRDADCNVRTEIELRFSAWGDGPEYADAVRCLHQQLERAVDQIMAVDDDPVIVIQGDHGPRLGIDWNVPGGVTLGDEMHFSILSAIRLPSSCPNVDVPDDLTSVNTFRIVRACLEGTAPALLEDITYPIHAER